MFEEASKSELGKRAGQLGEGISKSAKEAAESISEKSQALGKTGAFQTISQTAEAVRQELDQQGIQGLHKKMTAYAPTHLISHKMKILLQIQVECIVHQKY